MKNKVVAPKPVMDQIYITTQSRWRKRKRAEFDEILKKIEAFRWGCAYVPGYREITDTFDRLTELRKGLSQKEWGK